jgi:hypothetical protein
MSLINLKTQLRSLRYGNDSITGGSDGQPYVTSQLNPDFLKDDHEIGNTGGLDSSVLIRGGGLLPKRILDDEKRLSRFLLNPNNINGVLFTVKQNLLSRLAVKTEASKGIGYAGGILNEGVYLPTSTLLQAGLNPFGVHLNKQGIDPTGLIPSLRINKYFDVVTDNNKADDGKPTPSSSSPVLGVIAQAIDFLGFGGSSIPIGDYQNRLLRYFYNKNVNYNKDFGNVDIDSYGGGPGSKAGVGKTHIRFADKRTVISSDRLTELTKQNVYVMDYKMLFNQPQSNTVSQDFRKTIVDTSEIRIDSLASTDYTKFNRSTYGLGNPSQRGLDRSNPTKKLKGEESKVTLDEITFSPLYIKANGQVDSKYQNKDLVDFYISTIDNDGSNNNIFIHFRAFVENFTDNYRANWSPNRFAGRGDNFYVYSDFTRDISLSFKVHAQSKPELDKMYVKLNYLASILAPDYTSGFMNGNLVRLTFGDYLNSVPGIITNLTYNIPNESPWDIGRDADGNKTDLALPHLIDVSSFSFTPIHDFLPRRVTDDYVKNSFVPENGNAEGKSPDQQGTEITSPFITLGTNKSGYKYQQ